MNAALRLIESSRDDSSVSIRLQYQRMLEDELNRWVEKCQQAFSAAFLLGQRGGFRDWTEAFDFWIKKREES